jgi:hypothetical protein
MRRIAPLLAILSLAFAAPAGAQIGINGTRQAATTGPVDSAIGRLSRCGRSSRGAFNAMAGREARGVERERLAMDYRRLRYAGSGLTEAEEAVLEARARRLEAEAGRAWRYSSYERGAYRRHAAGGRRSHRGC